MDNVKIWPSNDEGCSEEILAAELAQNPDVFQRWLACDVGIDASLFMAYGANGGFLTLGFLTAGAEHMEINGTLRILDRRNYWAGWLAQVMSNESDEGWPWDPSRPVAGQYEDWLLTQRPTVELPIVSADEALIDAAQAITDEPWPDHDLDDAIRAATPEVKS